MEDKITRIELQLDKHSIQIAKLFSKIDDTNGCIVKINNSLCNYASRNFRSFKNSIGEIHDRIFNKHSANSIRLCW